MSRPICLATVLALCAGALGCRVSENNRGVIGQRVPVRVVESPGQELRSRPLERPHAQLAGPPEPVAFDRSDWEPVVFLVPNDWVLHHPEYTLDYIPADVERASSEYPNPLSALEMPVREPPAGTQEGLIEWGVAATDVLLFLPRLVVNPIWDLERSPQWGYERQRRRGWLALALSAGVERAAEAPEVGHPGVVRRFAPPPPVEEAGDDEPQREIPPAERSAFEPEGADAPAAPADADSEGAPVEAPDGNGEED